MNRESRTIIIQPVDFGFVYTLNVSEYIFIETTTTKMIYPAIYCIYKDFIMAGQTACTMQRNTHHFA